MLNQPWEEAWICMPRVKEKLGWAKWDSSRGLMQNGIKISRYAPHPRVEWTMDGDSQIQAFSPSCQLSVWLQTSHLLLQTQFSLWSNGESGTCHTRLLEGGNEIKCLKKHQVSYTCQRILMQILYMPWKWYVASQEFYNTKPLLSEILRKRRSYLYLPTLYKSLWIHILYCGAVH